jgi:hypothetical protein
MATGRSGTIRYERQASDNERATDPRADVVEILTTAVLAAFLQPEPRLSPNGASRPRQAPNSAISCQIRESR